MRIYTRYKAPRPRAPWRSALRFLVAAGGLSVAGWLILHNVEWEESPAAPSPTGPASRSPSPSAPRSNLARFHAPPAPRPTVSLPPPVASNTPPPGLSRSLPPAATSNAPAASSTTAVTVASSPPPPTPVPRTPLFQPRAVASVLEAQIALARRGFSSGSIDGVSGYQTRAALRAFQQRYGLPPTGALDPTTRSRLVLDAPPLTQYVVTSNDLARLMPIPPTWLGKSQQPRLDFVSLLELVAENHRAHPALLRRLNPEMDWPAVAPGRSVVVPDAAPPPPEARLAFLRIRLRDRMLTGHDLRTNVILHCPCSIAARVDKRPVGRLEVVVVAINPTYTFNPAVFPESAEGRRLGRKLTLPPGPNNPVGVAWIGLDRPGYGIHGTPRPEDVGRTESHGCFRLANWDAAHLAQLVWRRLPVYVEP